MSNNITELRKSGHIEEGIALGKKLIAENSADGWDYNALFWCYYDKVKKLASSGSQRNEISEIIREMSGIITRLPENELAAKQLERLKRTLIPEYPEVARASELSKTAGRETEAYAIVSPLISNADSSLHEEIGWVIFRYLKANLNIIESVEVRRMLARYMKLENPRPSLLHSMILQMALSYAKDHTDFIFYKFFQMWGPLNLRKEDYMNRIKDNIKYPSLIRRIISQIYASGAPLTPAELHEILGIRRVPLRIIVEEYRSGYFWNLYNLSKGGPSSDLWKTFDDYVDSMAQYGPSEFHSKILSLAARCMIETDQHRFIPFLLKWGPDNLREEDWEPEIGKENQKYDSKGAVTLKKCYEIIKANPKQNKKHIESLTGIFKFGSEKLKEDHWPKYRYAKLLLWIGAKNEAKDILKSISSELFPQSYFWQDLSEAEENPENVIALKIKALSLQPDEAFLGTARIDLAELLIKVGKLEYACVELKKYEAYKRGLNRELHQSFYPLWQQVSTYGGAESEYVLFCKECISKAEEVLFEDLPWKSYVISEIWKNEDGKERFTLVDDRGNNLSVSRRRFKEIYRATPGKVVEIRLAPSESRDNPIPVMARMTDNDNWAILPKKYGYVTHRNEDGVAYIVMPGLSEAIKVDKANEYITKGKFVTFRLLVKINNGKIHRNAVALRTIPYKEGLEQFPQTTVVIDDVNDEKKLYHYVNAEDMDGIIKKEETTYNLMVGDCLDIIYFTKKDKNGNQRAYILKPKLNKEKPDNLVKKFNGFITFPRNRSDFGFVDDFYVPKRLASKFSEDDHVFGRAVYTGKGKWKVFDLKDRWTHPRKPKKS